MRTFAAPLLVACAAFFHTTRAAADEDNAFRARFTVETDEETINAKACELAGATSIDGRARVFDVRIDDRRCSPSSNRADAISLTVHVEPRLDGRHDVVLQVAPPEGVSLEDARVALLDAAGELRSRVSEASRQPSVEFAQPKAADETPDKPEKQKSNPGLFQFGVVSLVVGGAAVGAGAITGIVTAFVAAANGLGCGFDVITGNASSCSTDVSSGWIATVALLGGGVAFVLTGVISMAVGGHEVARVSAYATPTGGGLRVAF